jgi:hypothetical protein
MSGGHYDYIQFQMGEAIEQLMKDIYKVSNNHKYYQYSNSDTLPEMLYCLLNMVSAETTLHRLDWMLSGDDGEDTFHDRLIQDYHHKWWGIMDAPTPEDLLEIVTRVCEDEWKLHEELEGE